eukprot:5425264-Amphidinium_carterae.1
MRSILRLGASLEVVRLSLLLRPMLCRSFCQDHANLRRIVSEPAAHVFAPAVLGQDVPRNPQQKSILQTRGSDV